MPVNLPRPRLRTVLLAVNLLILTLPFAGVVALRIYENELIRGTEAQLVGQGALVREAFVEAYRRAAGMRGDAIASPQPEGLAPVPPRIDVASDALRPPAAPAEAPDVEPDPVAAAAGVELGPVLRRAARTTLSGIRVVDAHGIVVATSRSEGGRSLAAREEVRRALDGEDVALLRVRRSDEPRPPLESISRGQRYRVFVAMPARDGDRIVGAVVLSRTPLDIVKALYLHRRALWIGGGAVLLVVVAVSVLTALTIARPVAAVALDAERVASGAPRPPRRPASFHTRETARLESAIGEMSSTLERRADTIRTFAAHVSHELKTPLTTIRGTSELLADHHDAMTQEERRRFLDNLSAAAARIEHLVRRMLELARADVVRPGGESAVVAAAVDRAAARARETGLAVEVEHGVGAARARIGVDTLADALGSLLENARQHAGEGARARIATRIERDEVVLRVEDDGAGISEANAGRVFTPFFTTARERGGSGLGLSIVRALIEAHGGAVTLARARPGAAFEIRLPAAAAPL